MKYIITFLILFSYLKADETIDLDSVYQEGIVLFEHSKTAWLGNEILIDSVKKYYKIEDLGGYFSYPKDDFMHFVFYNKDNKVIAETYFDSTFNAYKENISLKDREFSEIEKKYYKIQQRVNEIRKIDSTIKYYENTGMNVVPIIFRGKIKCYFLTAPKSFGQVIYGNDYLIELSNELKDFEITDLHKTIIPIPYATDSTKNNSYHTHTEEVGHLPTVSDIAITFLYGKLAGWKNHIISSPKITTILNIESKKMNVTKNPNEKNKIEDTDDKSEIEK